MSNSARVGVDKTYVRTLLGAVVSLLADGLSPPQCAACDRAVSRATVFCVPCAATVDRSRSVLERSRGPAILSFARYGGALAIAVQRLKYGARPDLARPLGHLLRQAARDARLEADVVVPVPLHARRLAERGYNQAALLARVAAPMVLAPCHARALERVRPTGPQVALGREERAANVAGAFRVRSASVIKGKRVVLVDDIATTGATLEACASALYEASASRVDAWVIGRAD